MLRQKPFFLLPLAFLASSVSNTDIDFARMSIYQQNLLLYHEHSIYEKNTKSGRVKESIGEERDRNISPISEDDATEYPQAKTRVAVVDSENGAIFGDGKEFLHEGEAVLTFDDGPNPETTPYILDILKRHNIKAMFFIVGHRLYSHPQAKNVLKRIAREGHSIANHSYTHPGMKGLLKISGRNAVLNEIASTQQAAFNTIGFADPFFRFPGGTYNDELQQLIKDNRLTNWKWNIDSLDYMDCKKLDSAGIRCLQKFTVPEMTVNAINNVSKGLTRYKKGIVLFHDIKPQTVAALPAILKEMMEKNYTFVLPQVSREESRRDSPLFSFPTQFKTQ